MGEMEEKKFQTEESEIPKKRDYEKELIAIIKSGQPPQAIRKKLEAYHENDIASIWEELTKEERLKVYRLLGNDTVSEIFTYLGDEASRYLEELGLENAADILESMDADDAADILDEMEDETSDRIIRLMDEESRHDIGLIQSYEDDEIGSRMTTNFIVIQRGLTIPGAMKELVKQAADNDNISTIYVVDQNESFCGAIDLKDLIIARKYMALEDLITTSFPYVYAKETIDECIEELKDYSEASIPVLDNRKKILGVITAQDIVEVVDEEMGEDYARLAGLTAEEDLNEPLLESMKKRIPWLVVLLVLGLVVSAVVGIFEQVVSQLTLVVSFQSLILGMAGNAGTQSLAVTIRVLMDENLTGGQKLRLMFKEMRVGAVNGFLLGMLSLIFIGFYIEAVKGRGFGFSFAVSACIGFSLMIAMLISSIMGTVIPMLFHKIKVDPAVASGPLITTVNDLVAVVTYYGLTWILLINVLRLAE
ncbi:MAG: magnesium transporter [Eubacterium sp.]|nr:magnesium transporter [Eubacterium sp.]